MNIVYEVVRYCHGHRNSKVEPASPVSFIFKGGPKFLLSLSLFKEIIMYEINLLDLYITVTQVHITLIFAFPIKIRAISFRVSAGYALDNAGIVFSLILT